MGPNISFVECPNTRRSCLPASLEECEDTGDPDSCYLGALLGECERNPSYYLPFCSHACRQFIPVCSLKERNLLGGSSCSEFLSLRSPTFSCGKPEAQIRGGSPDMEVEVKMEQ